MCATKAQPREKVVMHLPQRHCSHFHKQNARAESRICPTQSRDHDAPETNHKLHANLEHGMCSASQSVHSPGYHTALLFRTELKPEGNTTPEEKPEQKQVLTCPTAAEDG